MIQKSRTILFSLYSFNRCVKKAAMRQTSATVMESKTSTISDLSSGSQSQMRNTDIEHERVQQEL